MKSRLVTIIVIVVCLIAGFAIGHGAGRLIYEPKIEDLEARVSALTSEVSELTQTVSGQETQISNHEAEISSQEAQIIDLESEKSGLESDLAEAKQTIMNYEAQMVALESQIISLQAEKSGLQAQLDDILSIDDVLSIYEWNFAGTNWRLTLPVSLSLYVEYVERPRPILGAAYVDMAKDPKDDVYIDNLIQQINSTVLKSGFTEVQKLNFVISFVQNLPYTVDAETTPYDEYPRYPIQTLFDRGGDCEDTSILAVALLDRMGYDTALLHLENAQHMAVGVSIAVGYGSYYNYDGKRYYYLETTGEGWQIGEIPPSVINTTAYVYPLRG